MMLADMGADVIKIEQRVTGDETRHWGPPFRGASESQKAATYFMSVNRNKRSMTVDLKHPEGKKIVQDLLTTGDADVFIENFMPSTIKKLSLDYESVKDLNKSLIYASVCGYPQDSEWADKAAFDLTIQAMCGFMHITGEADGPPQKVGWALTDVFAGQQLFSGVLAAIMHLERTGGKGRGEGQLLQTSLLESSIYALNYVTASWLNGNYDYTRQGNSHPLISPYTVFKTADKEYLVIGVATDNQFATFTKVLGVEHLASEPRFITNKARCANNTALYTEL